MQTRIYLITHPDGCWFKAELSGNQAEATAAARYYGGQHELG